MATDDNQNQNRKNINSASEADLRALPFMNEQRAKLIMNYIDARGPITSAAQLDDIPNIGEKLSQLISDHFDFDDSGSSDSDGRRSGSRQSVGASGSGGSRGRGSDDDDDNRGGSNKASGSSTAEDGDGRHNNPGRPAGIPRDAKYAEGEDGDDGNGSRGGSNKSR